MGQAGQECLGDGGQEWQGRGGGVTAPAPSLHPGGALAEDGVAAEGGGGADPVRGRQAGVHTVCRGAAGARQGDEGAGQGLGQVQVDVGQEDRSGFSPLVLAVYGGHTEAVEAMLRRSPSTYSP